MKKTTIVILLFNVLSFSAAYSYSCSGSAFYDINRTYTVKSDGVYYDYSYKTTQTTGNKKELIPKIEESRKLKNADKESFEMINKYFGKDKNSLYYKNKKLGSSEDFESLGAYYTYKPCTTSEENYVIKNNEYVFINDKKINLDSETVQIIYLDTKQNPETGFTIMNFYTQDKSGVYYYSEFEGKMLKILDAPLKEKEYKILQNNGDAKFLVTPYKVFLSGKEINGINAKTFSVIPGTKEALSKDKENYFRDWTMISKEEFQKYRKSK